MKRMTDPEAISWVIDGVLARACRPGYHSESGPTPEIVAERIQRTKAVGIRSIICLLDNEKLQVEYLSRGIDLLEAYRIAGFELYHCPVDDYQEPPVPRGDLDKIIGIYRSLPEPVLVHCSAGVDRTQSVINSILDC